MGKKQSSGKIDTSGRSDAWAKPFASLNIEGLPAGPDELSTEGKPIKSPDHAHKKGRVVLRRETAHRGGKTVVVAGDFEISVSAEDIEVMARELRKVCGCGGTMRGREIEIQGEQPGRVAAYFRDKGFRVAGVTG